MVKPSLGRTVFLNDVNDPASAVEMSICKVENRRRRLENTKALSRQIAIAVQTAVVKSFSSPESFKVRLDFVPIRTPSARKPTLAQLCADCLDDSCPPGSTPASPPLTPPESPPFSPRTSPLLNSIDDLAARLNEQAL
jgi:hypothetical protein